MTETNRTETESIEADTVEIAIRRIEAASEAASEAARLHWITPGAGQALLYQRKAEEAERLVAASGRPKPADYPILAASVGIEGPDLAAVARLVLQRRDAWAAVAARIEAVRQRAKTDLRASSPAERAVVLETALDRLAAIHPGAPQDPPAQDPPAQDPLAQESPSPAKPRSGQSRRGTTRRGGGTNTNSGD